MQPVQVEVVSTGELGRLLAGWREEASPTPRRVYVHEAGHVFHSQALESESDAETLASFVSTQSGTVSTEPSSDLPHVSVVIPCSFQRPESIQRCVAHLLASYYPDFDIVIVNNRPTSGKSKLTFGDDPRVQVIDEPKRGISAARNAGVRAARGPVIAFTDDDVVVTPWWVGTIAKCFMSGSTTCVTGLVLPYELSTDAQVLFEDELGGFRRGNEQIAYERDSTPWMIRRTSGEVTKRLPLYVAAGNLGVGANMAYSREALDAVGPFPEFLGAGTMAFGGEEILLFARILSSGGAILYEPRMLVRHEHRRSMEELERQIFQGGVSVGAWLTYGMLTNSNLRRSLATEAPGAVGRRLGSLGTKKELAQDTRRSDSKAALLKRRELAGLVRGPSALARSYLRNQWTDRNSLRGTVTD